jgi:two-component system phosphate regulon sensor histidine kinase PhoR
MEGLFGRIVAVVFHALVGAGIGGLIGALAGAPLGLSVTGAICGASLSAFVDRWRGARVLLWLRTAPESPAPRESGFWGELAYRMERVLSQREQRTQAERDKLRQFLTAIEASPNGVLLLDAQGQIEWCNRVAADHFGLDPVRDVQQRITNLVRVPAFVAYLQQGAFDRPVVYPNPRAQGTLSVLVRPYGEGLRLVLSQDVTERVRAEAMRRDFVANVSHEIRTPLTVLAGFVETLATLPLSEAERSRVLTLMQQQTDRMQALVADLLTLAQLEGSPRPSAESWLPVRRLLAQALADGRALSAGRHALTLDEGLPADEVSGAPSELQSALANLVTNAVRYTPEGGHVWLCWVRAADGGGVLEVRDDGPGIAREHLSRLTERFYRVDGGRSRDTGGTGLGLSIVKHVMQRHGGQIDIQSEFGRGSTFRLLLPAARVRSCVAEPAGDAASSQGLPAPEASTMPPVRQTVAEATG